VAARRAAVAREVPLYLPAASAATELLASAASLDAPAAQEAEAQAFATLAKSQSAAALVRNFISQQGVRRLARQLARSGGSAADGTQQAVARFASPLPGASLVEIEAGPQADSAAVARAAAEAIALGKTPLRVAEGSQGLVRRVHSACMRGCEVLLAQGVAADAIDAAMRQAGWAAGPFAADALLTREEAGVASRSQPTGATQVHSVGADIVERLLLALMLEAVRVLDEGVVGTAAEVDLGLQLGLGFPRHLGGPLHHADWLGLPEVCARAARAGEAVPAALQARAARGERFYAA
jgi:3-hydroxyacyl-CoA dehydrogenase/enoyl-CoA hydratase/3-hydroxybutyryl-CoA epimerase/enoyl-CoA isomerase